MQLHNHSKRWWPLSVRTHWPVWIIQNSQCHWRVYNETCGNVPCVALDGNLYSIFFCFAASKPNVRRSHGAPWLRIQWAVVGRCVVFFVLLLLYGSVFTVVMWHSWQSSEGVSRRAHSLVHVCLCVRLCVWACGNISRLIAKLSRA